MQIPQIRLNQTYAQIGLRTIQPVQEIHQQPAELSINQIPAKMTIDRTPSKLEIDQEQARYEMISKTPGKFSDDMAEEARQDLLEIIAKIAREGNQMAAIENKTNAFVNIAGDNANPPPADFNIAFIPSHGSVKINYAPSELNIDWQPGSAKIEWNPNKPIHNYTPGKTEVYLRQQQKLEIDFVGLNVNSKI